MFGLVGCPALQTIRKYFIIGSLISRIYCNWRASIKQPREEEKEKQRERMKGGGKRQQMLGPLENFRQPIKDRKLEELLFRPLFNLTCSLRMD